MTAQVQTRLSVTDLNQKIFNHIQQLAEATDEARRSAEMQKYLQMCARFHRYSLGNIWLILIAKPDASMVAGFHKWQSMGRYVRKGEKGIPILAPIQVKSEKDVNEKNVDKLIGFKVVYVFDISQTDGKPLPKAPNWKSPEKNEELSRRLIQFAQSKGIKVRTEHLKGDVQGVSEGGSIILSPEAGTKTLIHEIAHELMHQQTNEVISQQIEELQAEAVACVVGSYFGMEGLNSSNYIALFGADAKSVYENMDLIRKNASLIIIPVES